MIKPALNQSWMAAIELGFAPRAGRTAIVHRKHVGPLRVQFPFYPEGDVCHVYLLHPPGGVVGGDQLDISIVAEASAHALITTPASGKFYRSDNVPAIQRQTITIKDDAIVEWLPQDTILYADSYVHLNTRVNLSKDARFIGWDILCLGRPASGEAYDAGICHQALELWRVGQPLLIERARYEANSRLLVDAWGMQNKTVVATLIATSADQTALAAARSVESLMDESLLSCSLINDVLVCRLLCNDGEHARLTMKHLWQAVRPCVLGRQAAVPRIWNT